MKTPATLVVIRSSPFGSTRATEGLDAVLAFAIFDQPLAVLFMDDGVLGLRPAAAGPSGKSFQKMVAALPLYDVEHIYVVRESLADRAMTAQHLVIDACPLDGHEVRELVRSAKHILSF